MFIYRKLLVSALRYLPEKGKISGFNEWLSDIIALATANKYESKLL